MYALGIDLGTTYTAVATWRDGRAEIAPLGSRAAAIPSVVLLRQDDTFLTGETANRRALTEPGRVAREFKRRLGDPTPILLGGAPYSAEALTGRLLRSVVDEVATREGGPASSICVCHPANWGPYKTDLLRQSIRIANLDQRVSFTTEPEAAAVFYAQQQRIEPGAIIAVYDLGGGTFDAAVLRKTRAGFEILGQPEGIERLGGIDFDAAVFNHVSRALGGKLEELDEDEPAAIAAVGRLREECTDAKEALSADTDVTIPVLLPNISTEVRLTRAELETMVRPSLYDSIEALKRAVRSAGVEPEQLHSVLLVGGSSRMPIVAQLVSAELGRPVAVDAHPKHAVALGAAWIASGSAGASAGYAPQGGGQVGYGRPGRNGADAGYAAAAGSVPGGHGAPGESGQSRGSVSHAASGAAAASGARSGSRTGPAAAGGSAGVAGIGAEIGSRAEGAPGARSESVAPAGPDAPRADPVTPPPRATPPRATPSRVPLPPPDRPGRAGDFLPPITPAAAKDAAPTEFIAPVTRRPARQRPAGEGARTPGATVPPATVPPARPRDSVAWDRAARDRALAAPVDSGHPPRRPRDTGPTPPIRDNGPPMVVSGGRGRGGRIRAVLIALLVLAALAAAGTYAGVALAKKTNNSAGPGPSSPAATEPAANALQTTAASTPTAGQTRPVPEDERCTRKIRSNLKWVCLTDATFDGNQIVITYQADFGGLTPTVHGGFHLHIYGGDGTNPPDSIEGRQAASPGRWYVEDQNPSIRTVDSNDYQTAIGPDAKKVCARVANSNHELVPDTDGTFHTGNCVPIRRI